MAGNVGNITAMREGLAANASTIEGLRVNQEIPEQVAVPAFVVLGINEIDFDKTMVRGTDRITFDCLLIASRADARNAQRTLDAYLSLSGPESIKVALQSDATLGGTCEDLRLVRINDYGALDIGGVTYLSARLEVEIYVAN
jgi:hypothetical protein